jgi:hypothetical protein
MATKLSRRYDIYLITNSVDDYWYVGSTVRGAKRRFREHVLGSGAPRLTAKIQELGVEAFSQAVVEIGQGSPLEAEQRWYDFGVECGAGHPLQYRPYTWQEQTVESKAKISASLTGRERTSEHRANLSSSLTGRTLSPEHCQKMSENRTGKTNTEESKDKVRQAMLGREITWANKISDAQKGHSNLNEEQRARVSVTLKAKGIAPPFNPVACRDCDMITTPGPLAMHCKGTGHHPVKG